MYPNLEPDMEMATLGGGCFWCLEAVYDRLEGVTDVVSGYSGGIVPSPSYTEVTGGRTGHAEVVQVTFDTRQISYREILEIFFTIHDPTTLNRQGADVGPQYRSVIFTHSESQQAVAQEMIRELDAGKIYNGQIVTEVRPLDAFYPAEDYHQEYFTKHPDQGYCQVVIAPKLAKMRKKYSERMRA